MILKRSFKASDPKETWHRKKRIKYLLIKLNLNEYTPLYSNSNNIFAHRRIFSALHSLIGFRIEVSIDHIARYYNTFEVIYFCIFVKNLHFGQHSNHSREKCVEKHNTTIFWWIGVLELLKAVTQLSMVSMLQEGEALNLPVWKYYTKKARAIDKIRQQFVLFCKPTVHYFTNYVC